MRLFRTSQLVAAALLAGIFVVPGPIHGEKAANASGAEEIYLATEVIEGSQSSQAMSPVAFQGKLYFTAQTPELGRELYVFDGVSTSLVVDFFPGSGSGAYSTNGILGVYNNRLMLVLDDGSTGYELYQFDGSAISLVVDAKPGAEDGYPSHLIEYNGQLYFDATTFVTDSYGFVWDYVNPPQLLSQVHSGYNLVGFRSPAIVGSDLYFVARTSGQRPGIVKFDGTSFSQLPLTPENPNSLFAFNGELIYYAKGVDGNEPWRFDGTTQIQIADLNPGTADAFFFAPVVQSGNLVFRARTNAAGFEMWTWDGTNAPSLVADLYSGSMSGHNSIIYRDLSGEIIFLGNDGSSGIELWGYDGTTQSRLVSSNPLGVVNYSNGSGEGALLGGTLYFAGTRPETGAEIYAFGVKPAGFAPSSVPQPVTLDYDANGGSGTLSLTQLPGSITLSGGSGFARQGYTLAGWDSDSSSATATYSPGGSFSLTQSTTLFAIWQQNPPPVPTQTETSPAPMIRVPELTNIQDLQIPPSGGSFVIEGSRLGGVSEAFIAGLPAEIIESTTTRLVLDAPQLAPGKYDLLLITEFGRITYQGAIEYVDVEGALISREGKVVEETFEIAGFAPGSSALTGRMKHDLGKRVSGLRPLVITCVGQTMGPTVLDDDELLASRRGAAVCQLLSRWFGLPLSEVQYINHTSVGARFRSTLVTLSWVE